MTLVTPEIRALVGQEVLYTSPEPLGRAAIRYYSVAVRDNNPFYTDVDLAAHHGYADVIAPPTLICDTNQYTGLPMDENGSAGHNWGLSIPGTRLVRAGNAYVFHRPVLASDVVTARWRLESVEERVNTRGLEMVIVTSTARYTDADGNLLTENTETLVISALETS